MLRLIHMVAFLALAVTGLILLNSTYPESAPDHDGNGKASSSGGGKATWSGSTSWTRASTQIGKCHHR